MAQQTAVEWLIMQLPVKIRVELYEQNIHEQAKEMEKEQIIEAYKYGNQSDVYYKPEQYYNETFSNNK